ncbi:MAG: nucleotide exchange factor GrpE [Bacteroidales bacterium]|nr:nucleotide exchange factor GrpE [Bacteroidales bacterium]
MAKETLSKKVKDLTESLEKEKEDYTRLLAEFETFRRRTAEDRINIKNTASADTIKELLPTLDACEQAMKMLEKSEDSAAREGTKLNYEQMMGALRKRGLEVIDAKGKDFDTDFHEAMTQFPAPSEDLKGKVLEVTRTGYTLNGKVLRYAQVVVGA